MAPAACAIKLRHCMYVCLSIRPGAGACIACMRTVSRGAQLVPSHLYGLGNGGTSPTLLGDGEAGREQGVEGGKTRSVCSGFWLPGPRLTCMHYPRKVMLMAHACRTALRWSRSGSVRRASARKNQETKRGCSCSTNWLPARARLERFCLGCEVGVVSGISLPFTSLRPDTATNKLARPVRPVLLTKRGKQHTRWLR